MNTAIQIGSDQLTALSKLFNRRWWWQTIIVIAGVLFLARLGVWQLDRLEQRRIQNAYELTQWRQDPFRVNQDTLPADLDELAYRRIVANGRFDYSNQVIWGYQTFMQQTGVRLVTPLIISNADDENVQAVLVVRGWVPNNGEGDWRQYDEMEDASIVGRAFKSQLLPNGVMPTLPTDPNAGWFYINIEAIQPQMPYTLLPFIVVQLPESGRTLSDFPMREIWVPAASEGSHLSYALQWFCFALILGFGYLQFILWQERREERVQEIKQDTIELSTSQT